ncbi:MAG: hypothetical protein ACR2HF_02380 [Methylococcaceae bacterium]
MTDTENDALPKETAISPESPEITPSWKPLWWVLGSLTLIVVLGEFALDFIIEGLEFLFEIIEHIYLLLVEAPEEILEDYIEDWLAVHYPLDASRYSEMVTAIGLTPVKILVGIVLLKALLRYIREHGFPRIGRWVNRHYQSVRLAIKLLAWPYKVVAVVLVLGILLILI